MACEERECEGFECGHPASLTLGTQTRRREIYVYEGEIASPRARISFWFGSGFSMTGICHVYDLCLRMYISLI